MLYLIIYMDGTRSYVNERIIQRIDLNSDGTYTLYHFDDSKVQIKDFAKLHQ